MGLRINNASGLAYQQYVRNSERLGRSMERLSSGLRINRPSDDPAGMALANRLRSVSGGLTASARAIQDARGATSTAETGLGQVTSILQRVRDLAVEYNSGMLDANQKFAITSEVTQLQTEIDSIINGTTYRGTALLTGGAGQAVLTIQAGSESTDTMTLPGIDVGASIGTAVSDFAAVAVAGTADIAAIDTAMNNVSADTSVMATSSNRLEDLADYIDTYQSSVMDSESRIMDTDLALEMSEFTKRKVTQDAGLAMIAQSNLMHSAVLKLFDL